MMSNVYALIHMNVPYSQNENTRAGRQPWRRWEDSLCEVMLYRVSIHL